MGTTTFVWDPVFDCVTHELDENNNVKAEYHNETQQYGGVLSQRRGTTSHYHHHDALGSTRFLTDSSGNVTDTYLNDAWGTLVASTGTTVNPFKWVGKYGYYSDDSTAQVYVRARMYQPTVARWCSVDPLEFLEGLNRFSLHMIVQKTDPSGLITVTQAFSENLTEQPCGVTPVAYWLFRPTSVGGWPCDGLLVQIVEVDCQTTRCASKKEIRENKQPQVRPVERFKYLEVWKVQKSETNTDPEGQIPPAGRGSYTDRAYYTPDIQSWGYYIQSSSIALFCKGRNKDGTRNEPHMSDTDYAFNVERIGQAIVGKGTKCSTGSGKLRGIAIAGNGPAWWTSNNPQEGIAHRTFGVDWDCCKDCNIQDAGASQSNSIELDID